MNIKNVKRIIVEEVTNILESSITKNFEKAIEAYSNIQLKQQQLRKKFVGEKDPKKKEAFKQSLIKLHKEVQKAELEFNKALKTEPIDAEFNENLTEANKYPTVSNKFKNALDNLPEKYFHRKGVEALIKKLNEKDPKAAMAYTMAAFGWMKNMKEGKLNEDVWKNFIVDLEGGGKLLKATNTDNRKTVKARSTSKVWDDGVPVLKYIARASKKSSPFPKGKFKVAHDTDHGWWYYQLGKTWYGIDTKDYSTPPFEY